MSTLWLVNTRSGDGAPANNFLGKAKLALAQSLQMDSDVEAHLNRFHWAGVHTTAKTEYLCKKGKGPDKDGYSLVLAICFSGKMFDSL